MSRRCDPVLPMFPKPDHAKGPSDYTAQVDDTARERVRLKAASPLRGAADQHDASDLALFRASNEPGLDL